MKSAFLRKTLLASLVGMLGIPLTAPAQAADYPDKPITFVVPFGAGSATDQFARAIGQGVSEQIDQPVVIENKPGASAMIGASDVARAAPDGYRVLITTNTSQAANPHLYKKLSYDPVKDFQPITLLGTGGQIMVVNPSSPAKTVKDFIKLAKENPGKLTFGSGSSSSRVAGELFQQMADVELLHVPYKSNPLVITDLLGGQIDMMMADMATGLPQVKAGKLRALGVTDNKPLPLAPDIAPIADSGVPGYKMGYWFGAYVPANTPKDVVSKLHDLIVNATTRKAAQQFYSQTGTKPVTSTPDELAKFQADETKKWGEIIKKAGIQPS
ncbi:Bug family tripartite tricarboxylate transporter substrate binding protein [Pollutimonas harenae]|uniref:Tripartite tricarboxylate transporter substrate binding protein n=1 Tax=Pollutimonas harenae TaxID=657015 RepID=A0A853GS30_9BURK|nr:tripartite tricarboxylate transporter substrate binding protein [Pollutimonas harenae]NYT85908.1 tripartite tricarboxylate transporter substrate binding protein [Pollutimonas harenae]TEA70961.1 tripartite tricarboxylate transporter substrate binding protein [Pollutimonas harenae]